MHYNDVIMSTIASQVTSLANVYSIVYSGADQSKHQSSASLAFVWGIYRGPVNSPHKGPVTRKMFPFDDVIMEYRNPRKIWSPICFRFVCGLCRCIHYGVPWPWASLLIVLRIHIPYWSGIVQWVPCVRRICTFNDSAIYCCRKNKWYLLKKTDFPKFHWKFLKGPLEKNTSLVLVMAWRIPSLKTNSVQLV